MPSYICKLCNFQTTFRRNYIRHLKTKKHINNEKIWNNYEETNNKCSENFLSEPKSVTTLTTHKRLKTTQKNKNVEA